MAKTVSCRDVGMDCDFVAKGETEQDILQQCAEHARKDHDMTDIPAEITDQLRGWVYAASLYEFRNVATGKTGLASH